MPATNTAPKSFPAKYAGICARTGERFQVGTAIVRDGRGYALAETITAAAPAAPATRPVVGPVVGCEIVDLTAEDFFRTWDGGTDHARGSAMVTYQRMCVAARAQVQAEMTRRLEAGEQAGRAWMVAMRAAHAAARLDTSVNHADRGEDIIFHSEARVSMQGDRLHLHVPSDAIVYGDAAKEWASVTLAGIRAALEAAGIVAHVQIRKQGDLRIVWQKTGDWYMGSFHCSGRSAALRIVTE
mgnify:FL=1